MIAVYNTNYVANPNSYITCAVVNAFSQLGEKVVLLDNRTIVPFAAKGGADLLVCIDGQRLRLDILNRVRPSFESMALWLFEDPFMVNYNVQNIGLFDYVFTNDPGCVKSYGLKGFYLPLAADKNDHYRSIKDDLDLDWDICFAGTMWPNRIRVVQDLLNEFGDKRLKLICPTNNFLPPLPSVIEANSITNPVSNSAFVDFASRSRVTITLHRDYGSDGSLSKANAPGPRLFELAMAGACQLVDQAFTDVSSNAETETIKDGIFYSDSKEILFEEIRRLVENPSMRKERVTASQRWALNGQLYSDRVRVLLSKCRMKRRQNSSQVVVESKRRIKVLMCTHSTMSQAAWGGVEVYQRLLERNLDSTVEFFYWTRREHACQFTDTDARVLEQFRVDDIGWLDVLSDAEEEFALSRVISEYSIDVVHFQHLGHHALSLPIIAKSSGAGVVFSAHDYFLICSRYTLQDPAGRFCDVGEKDILTCDSCLLTGEGVSPGAQSVRRAFVEQVIQSVDVFLFGTDFSKELTRKIYPSINPERCETIGVPSGSADRVKHVKKLVGKSSSVLAVVISGNFIDSKGAETVLQVIALADTGRFKFCIMGKAQSHLEQRLKGLNLNNVEYLGGYRFGDLAYLDSFDVALFLSPWPETFSISLSEAWNHNLIPIASNIGAFADRIKDNENGLLVPVASASDVLMALEKLWMMPSLREKMSLEIRNMQTEMPALHYNKVRSVYDDCAPLKPLAPSDLRLDIGQVHLLSHRLWKQPAPPRHILNSQPAATFSLESPVDLSDVEIVDSYYHFDKIEMDGSSGAIVIAGWVTDNVHSLVGSLSIILAGESVNIFVDAQRFLRDDIVREYHNASDQSGFRSRLTLNGGWSDGIYHLLFLTHRHGLKAVCMTDLQLRLKSGQLVETIRGRVEEPGVNIASRLTGKLTGNGGLQLPALPLLKHHIFFNLDEVRIGGSATSWDGRLRGWAFSPELDRQELTIFALLIGEKSSQLAISYFDRKPRPDVLQLIPDAPENCGFDGKLPPYSGLPDGSLRLVMGCRDANSYCVAVTDKILLKDGASISVSNSKVSSQIERAVREALVPGWLTKLGQRLLG